MSVLPRRGAGRKHPGKCEYAFLSPSCPHFLHKGHNLTIPAVGLQTGPSLHSALGSQTGQNKPTGRCGCWWPDTIGWWRSSKSQGGGRLWGDSHLHDAVETRLEAAQVLLLHLNLLEDLLLVGQALSVLLRQPVEGGQSTVLGCSPGTPQHTCSPPDSTQW